MYPDTAVIRKFKAREDMSSNVETSGGTLDTVKLVFALLLIVGATIAFYLFPQESTLLRVAGILAAVAIAALVALQTRKGREIWGFVQGAQIEVRKVVWPTRQETVQTTLIVVVMVILVAIILWLLDMFLGWGIGSLLGRGAA
jgi:preprotein translocase subunit SecE